MALLDPQQLVASLRSVKCPCCGGKKKPDQTLCGVDYGRLSPRLRVALYDGLGQGYEEAVAEAFELLGVTSPHWPEVRGV